MKQLQDNRDYFRDMLDEDDSCKFTVVKPDIITKLLVEHLEEDAIAMCGYDDQNPLQGRYEEITGTCRNFANSDEVLVLASEISAEWSDMETKWDYSHMFDIIYRSGWSLVAVGGECGNTPPCFPLQLDDDEYIVLVRDVENHAISGVAALQTCIGVDGEFIWNKQITDDTRSYNDLHDWRQFTVTPYPSSKVSPMYRQGIQNADWVSPHIDFPHGDQYPPNPAGHGLLSIVPSVMFKCLLEQLDRTHARKNELACQARVNEEELATLTRANVDLKKKVEKLRGVLARAGVDEMEGWDS